MAAAGAQGSAQADLRTAFEDGDDHDVGDADPADQQGDRTQGEEKAVVGAFGGHFGLEDVGGMTRVDSGRVGRVDGGAQHGCDGVDLAGHGPQVDLARVAVESEVLLGDGEADEGHAVHLGDQLDRLEDADDREPVPADPDLGGVGQVVDAEQVGGFARPAPPPGSGWWPG